MENGVAIGALVNEAGVATVLAQEPHAKAMGADVRLFSSFILIVFNYLLFLQGHGLEEGVTIGPLINEAGVAKVDPKP